MTLKSLAKIDLPPTALVSETSSSSTDLGSHASTMELWHFGDNNFQIEWDIPGLEMTEHIGITTETYLKNGAPCLRLTDYDGVFSLPEEAVKFLTDNHIEVPDEFR